jgi:uncharacterized protein YlxW (UPF0749 family)
VTPGSHARPAQDAPEGAGTVEAGTDVAPDALPDTSARPGKSRRGWGWWRVGTPLVVLLCGALFVVSAENSGGTDLRPGRYIDLASLVSNEADDYAALKERVADLNSDVAILTNSVNDRDVNRYQRRIEKLEDPAGMVPRSGPGITVTLSDAPEDVINSTTLDLNYLVVHQQDIQAVVNAMWKGGATAVTIQGQRVVSTTGIKCEGNAVQLQGVPYSQPYVISAVGDQTALLSAIDSDSYLEVYRDQAADPDISVGWDLQEEDLLTAPAYDGMLDLNYATPLR